MTQKTADIENRLEQAEAEIAELKEQLAELGLTREEVDAMRNDVDFLRSELQARGIGPIPNPGPRPAAKPPDTVRAVRLHGAAHARASKEVGEGQGKVGTPAIKRKLEREARGPKKKRKRST